MLLVVLGITKIFFVILDDKVENVNIYSVIMAHYWHRRLQGGGQGGHGPPQRPDKNDKIAQFCSILPYLKKDFPGSMPPDPHNSLICSVFLALAAAGPRQCERLELHVYNIPWLNDNVFRLTSAV